jgi:bacteriocin-like protein
MSQKAIRKAPQITVDELAMVATTGIARALATRHAAGIELSSEELSQVSGGRAQPVIIDGMIPPPPPPIM